MIGDVSFTEDDLVEGNYYIHPNHGICRYDRVQYLEMDFQKKKYHVFRFRNADTLYIPSDQIPNLIRCEADFARKHGLSKVGSGAAAKALYEYETFIKTKLCLLQINAYQKILLHGLNSSKDLVLQTMGYKHTVSSLNEYIVSALLHSEYPDGYAKQIDAEMEDNTKTAIINFRLPSPRELPNTVGFKGNRVGDNHTECKMKDREFANYYESVIFQITLRTLYEIFQVTKPGELDTIVFNGWVNALDKATGNEFKSCILSIMVSRERFNNLNLERVSPKECVLHLKGLFVGRLHELAPVKPILEINRYDKRFIHNVEILHELHEGVNLAEMDWDDFEYLVRELFEKMFSQDGAEVKVTRASRDGGVDAVAFDNDPIKGGILIIQAKRYNNVVPVSAVRDLYGTVINEGAIKGILVTTSYFGSDSREFAKNKPITLMDGSNLVYLLNEYGYKSHIKLRGKMQK